MTVICGSQVSWVLRGTGDDTEILANDANYFGRSQQAKMSSCPHHTRPATASSLRFVMSMAKEHFSSSARASSRAILYAAASRRGHI